MCDTVPFESSNDPEDFGYWLQVSSFCDHWCARCRHSVRCPMAEADPPDPTSLFEEEPEQDSEELEAQVQELQQGLAQALEEVGIPLGAVEVTPMRSPDGDPLLERAKDWYEISAAWLASLPMALQLGEAHELYEVLGWHCGMVPIKILQALLGEQIKCEICAARGRERDQVRGSAKVAALGLHACVNALTRWCAARPLDQNTLRILAATTELLQQLQERVPDHMSFRRPGFDD